jgi:hypothetical protein
MIGPRTPGEPGVTSRQTGLGPQKRLFIILCIAMAVWISALVTMYFTTVYPQRRTPTPVQRENDLNDHGATTMG